MKTVFKNASEVIHKWANQTQENGKCSNVYFHGSEIYSYGSHFCMGKLDVNFGKIALLTDRTYSVTTAKHLHEVRYSVNHLEVIECAYPEKELEYNLPSLPLDGPVILRHVTGEDQTDYLQTSKGVTVSMKAAKVLYQMIKQGEDVKGHEIDGYTVISLNGCLHIGCHEIDRTEIERFAALMNW